MIPQEADQTHIEYGFPVMGGGDVFVHVGGYVQRAFVFEK